MNINDQQLFTEFAKHALQGLLASGHYTHIDELGNPELREHANDDYDKAKDHWLDLSILPVIEDAMRLALRAVHATKQNHKSIQEGCLW